MSFGRRIPWLALFSVLACSELGGGSADSGSGASGAGASTSGTSGGSGAGAGSGGGGQGSGTGGGTGAGAGSGTGGASSCEPVTSRCDCVAVADGVSSQIDGFEDGDLRINVVDQRDGEWFQARARGTDTPLGSMQVEDGEGGAPAST